MYIQITDDYEANDKKGVYVTLTVMGETQKDDEDDLVLFRIEDGEIVLYESQNGEFICKACGDIFNKENLNFICQWLTDKNGDVDIEIDLDWVDLHWDWRKRELCDRETFYERIVNYK